MKKVLTPPTLPIITCCKRVQKYFMAPFYGWCSTASRLEPLREDSLLFQLYLKSNMQLNTIYLPICVCGNQESSFVWQLFAVVLVLDSFNKYVFMQLQLQDLRPNTVEGYTVRLTSSKQAKKVYGAASSNIKMDQNFDYCYGM